MIFSLAWLLVISKNELDSKLYMSSLQCGSSSFEAQLLGCEFDALTWS